MKKEWQKLPEKFLERLELIVPPEELEEVQESFCAPKSPTFRVNTLKIGAEDLASKLNDLDFKLGKIPWNNDAFILENRSQKELTETNYYKEGFLYLQSLSSLIPALVLDPKPGEKVLDLCAAPGSKTTQIAALMKNRGEILANDKSHLRNYKLRANLELQGVKIAKVFEYPGEIFWKTFPETFDKTLVDVPCSLEGRFLTSNPQSYRDWSVAKIKRLSELQKWLLRSAISCAKPGATVVYATCTLAPEENEGVIDWILKKETGKVEIEKISIPQLPADPSLLEWGQRKFDPSLTQTLRILPSPTMEGFFVAKIRKLKSNVPSNLNERRPKI